MLAWPIMGCESGDANRLRIAVEARTVDEAIHMCINRDATMQVSGHEASS